MVNQEEISTNFTLKTNDTVTDLPPNDVVSESKEDSISYLLVPFFSLIIIIVLTISVIMLLHRKRRIDRLRHHLMPFYTFAPGEEEDWETELLESEEVHARRDYKSFTLLKQSLF